MPDVSPASGLAQSIEQVLGVGRVPIGNGAMPMGPPRLEFAPGTCVISASAVRRKRSDSPGPSQVAGMGIAGSQPTAHFIEKAR